jgi:hypothetical protein
MLGLAAAGGPFMLRNGSTLSGSYQTRYPLIFPYIFENVDKVNSFIRKLSQSLAIPKEQSLVEMELN